MAKNDMPGMQGNQPFNPYSGMWGPIGGGNAAPSGGNQTPWMPQSFNPGQQMQMARQAMAPGLNRMGAMFGQNQNPQAAFNRPQMPGQGQPPFLGLGQSQGQMGNPNTSLQEMMAAASIAPSQPQMLLEKSMPSMQPPSMMGGNIPPNAEAMMGKAVQPEMAMAEEPTAKASVAPNFMKQPKVKPPMSY